MPLRQSFFLAMAGFVALTGPAFGQTAPAPDAPPTLSTPPADISQDQAFRRFLDDVRRDAETQGVSPATLDAALRGVRPIARVLELDRAQPEFRLTYDEYISRVISDARVQEGRRLLRENQALLEQVSAQYGVPPRFIVALWGAETSFGRTMGNFRVIHALATLAFDGRRSAYFRGELMNALRILDEGHIAPNAMMGSWAGAMGQPQFMPSSFLSYAVDYDGDGRRDIWGTRADVFASAANYLARSGWRRDETWGREVLLPNAFDQSLADLKIEKSVSEWAALGLTLPGGGALPQSNVQASVVLPGGITGPAFLVYNNFKVIMRWNRSVYYATAIGRLADLIGQP